MTCANKATALYFITDVSELHINKSQCLVKKKYTGKSGPKTIHLYKQGYVQTNL